MSIPRQVPSAHTAPLSFQQRTLWDRYEHYPNDPHARISLSLRLAGVLNVDVLRAALDAVCQRHQALRTRIVAIDGVAEQLVDPVWCAGLQIVEKPGCHDQGRGLAVEFINEPMNLASGPLFKALLIRLGAREYILVLVMDHMIADGLSAAVLIRELWFLYARLTHSRSAEQSPQLPMQYTDYAIWQHRSHEIWKHQHESYWRERLSDAARIQLPIDADRSSVTPFRAAEIEIRVDPVLSEGLRQFARRERTTLPRVMLAVYAAWVAIVCGRRDFVLPFNIMGRHAPVLSSVVGLFAHILYLRVQFANQDSFMKILQRVDAELRAAHEHVDFGWMGMRMPEFHLGMRFQWNLTATAPPPAPAEAIKPVTQDIRIEKLSLPPPSGAAAEGRTRFDIVVNFSDSPQGIVGRVGFRADLFTAHAIGRLEEDLRVLIERALGESDACFLRPVRPQSFRTGQ